MQNMNPINAVALATALRSKKGQFGAVMVAITEERSLLKRAWKNTALAGAAVYKLSRMANLGVGWNYARVVQRRAEAVEPPAPWAFPAPFIPDPPSGMRCVEEFDDILYQGIKDPTKMYIRFYVAKNTSTTRRYVLVDGVPRFATPDEIEVIKSCLSTATSHSQKQAAMGIAEEDEVKPRAFAVESIIGLRWGDLLFGKDPDADGLLD